MPGIRSLLLATYLAVLLLPLAGIGVLRLYESELIRQTETELMAQAAVLTAAYRTAWLEKAPPDALPQMPKIELGWGATTQGGESEGWRLLQPQLDLAESPVLPRPAEASPSSQPAEAGAVAIAASLKPVVADVRRMTLAAIRILDARGIVVVSSLDEEMDRSLAAQQEVEQALRGAPKAVLRKRLVSPADYRWGSISRNTGLRVFVAVPAVADDRVLGAVLVSRTPRNIYDTLYSKRWALLETVIVLIIAVVALAWFAGYAVVRPTRQLEAMARRVARGEIHAVEPLDLPITREARSLSNSIVTMARALEARTEYVRDLALGISHEFKTPLTGIRGGAELLRDHIDEMSGAERERFLTNILQDTKRLDRLTRRLLELAQADVLTPQGDESCDLAAGIKDMVADAGRRGRRVTTGEVPPSLPAVIDRTSFDIVLSNLLENAQQHGGPDVTVSVSARAVSGEAIVEVADDGIGVPADDAGHIFDRFFTTARASGGTGLGLAIARRRVAAFGGKLALVPCERGAVFRISLTALA